MWKLRPTEGKRFSRSHKTLVGEPGETLEPQGPGQVPHDTIFIGTVHLDVTNLLPKAVGFQTPH